MYIKERIKGSFIELAQKRGLNKTTMDELALAAGISKRTIYCYFKSKDELIECVLENILEDIGQELDEILSNYKTAEEIFTYIPKAFYDLSNTFFSTLIIEDVQQYYPHLYERINNYRLKKARKVLEIILENSNKEYDHRIISTVVLSSLQAVINPEFLIANNIQFEDAVEQVVHFYKYGLTGS